jgi:Spy/CpxP family protein refolding chaperone
MKTRSLISIVSVLAIGLAVLTSNAFAQNQKREHRKDAAKHLADKLNLTDQQKQQIKALREQFRNDNAAALTELKALREQMREAMKNKDKEAAKALREQMKAKMEALKPVREQLRKKIGAILTPEQREMVEKLRAERQEKREDRREKWRKHHGAEGEAGGSGLPGDLN